VKVQRPGVKEQVFDDLNAIAEVAKIFDKYSKASRHFDFHATFEEFRKAIMAELDYRQEAHNLRTLRENLKDLDQIIVPSPIDEYSTTRTLTIEYIDGKTLTETSTVGLLRAERTKLASQVFYAYLQQFFVDGFVQADPDPASVILTNDRKVALLDLGIVARIAPAMHSKLIQLLLSINEGRADQAADLLMDLGEKRESFDETGFRRVVSDFVLINRDMAAEQLEIGKIIELIVSSAVQYGITLPYEEGILGRALRKVDRVAHLLDPTFDSRTFLNRNVSHMMHRHLHDALSPAHIYHTVLETAEFLEKLPGQFSKILDSVARNELKMTIHAIDERVLINGMQKIANRITVGLVLAALIIGAAMLMNIRSTFTIGGYPGIAILCFVAAAGCGFCLVLEVLISDRKSR